MVNKNLEVVAAFVGQQRVADYGLVALVLADGRCAGSQSLQETKKINWSHETNSNLKLRRSSSRRQFKSRLILLLETHYSFYFVKIIATTLK